MANSSDNSFFYRLTALWALSESGLGGVMHALKIPFTGFFVGGFAVVIIGLLAFYSSEIISRKSCTKNILQSTLIVCLVKAAVSPQSPIGAYIAVAFQGLAGSAIYRMASFKIASVILGIVALLESAFQKLFTLTVIFGKSWWQASDIFLRSLLSDLKLSSDFSLTFWLVGLYATVYAIWGIVIGLWIGSLPKLIKQKKKDVLNEYGCYMRENRLAIIDVPVSEKRKLAWWMPVISIVILAILIYASKSIPDVFYVVLRTLVVLVFVFYVAQPLFKWLLDHVMKKQSANNKQKVQSIISILPEIKRFIKPAYALASAENSGLKKYREFVLVMIVLSLYELKTDA